MHMIRMSIMFMMTLRMKKMMIMMRMVMRMMMKVLLLNPRGKSRRQ